MGILVEREIPTEFLRGLADGRYKAYGGVIRDVHGRIVAHLQTSSAEGMSQVASQISSLSGLASATVALQGLNLVVSAVGFAIVYDKLKKMDLRLQDMQADIKNILRKLDRAEFIQQLERRAEYFAQLDNLESGFRTGDNTRVSLALNALTAISYVHRELAGMLLTDIKQVYFEPHLVADCVRLALGSDLARAHAHATRNELDEAIEVIKKSSEWQNNCKTMLETPLSIKPLWLLDLSPDERQQIRSALGDSRQIPEALAYTENQFTFCKDYDITTQQLIDPCSDDAPLAVYVLNQVPV